MPALDFQGDLSNFLVIDLAFVNGSLCFLEFSEGT